MSSLGIAVLDGTGNLRTPQGQLVPIRTAATGTGPFSLAAGTRVAYLAVTGLSTAANATSSAIVATIPGMAATQMATGTVQFYLNGAYGTNGVPMVVNLGTTATGITFQIFNAHASNALLNTATVIVIIQILG